MRRLEAIPVSMHCWQGDDVGGFRNGGRGVVRRRHSGHRQLSREARTIAELRGDIEKALSVIPGHHRLNLHACYLDHGGKFVDRDQIEPAALPKLDRLGQGHHLGMDFNPTYFSHAKAADGFTLSHPDKAIRDFWIEHGIRCRRIGSRDGPATRHPDP